MRAVRAEVFHAGGRIDGQADGWTDRHDETDSRHSKY
jgi:hypothetical protein